MESTRSEVAVDCPHLFRIYKDGRIEGLKGIHVVVPPSLDPKTNVQSKDVVCSQEPNLSSRLFLPKIINPNQKLPLLVYYHGGGFRTESPFSAQYHNFCNKLVAAANIIIVSVDYRKAPEHHLPVAYDDSWTVLKWVASQVDGDGSEEWLNCYADLKSVFLAGDSAGGNIAHRMAMKYEEEKLSGINLAGIVLIHPYFWGKEPIGNEVRESKVRSMIDGFWHSAYPATSGCDDPLLNPATDPKFGSLGCSRVLIFVAEKDFLRDRGWYYSEILKKSGWGGSVEVVEAKEENHVFHLFNPENENAKAMLKSVASFINQEDHS